MVRYFSYILLASILAPGLLTSEPPQIPLGSTNNLPVEILFSGVTPFDSGATVLLRVSGKPTDITSPCKNKSSVINGDDSATVLQWKPIGTCPVPLVTIGKKNYLMPLNGYYPLESAISDISSDTLQNTLNAGSLLRADYRLASFRIRTFFNSIENVLNARKEKFSLPIPNTPLPTKATFLPNSPRPFRAE